MGTRGAVVLVVDGNEKTMYNHWDSYPSGLGADVLTWVRVMNANNAEPEIRESVRALRPTPDREPTGEEMEQYAEYRDAGVNRGEGWYSLLRLAQGDLNKTLSAGLFEPASDFPRDSLFCEWAYVVDFDARTFDVYEGFRKEPPTEGRWVGQAGTEPGYFPVQRVASWSFDSPPSIDDLCAIESAEDKS